MAVPTEFPHARRRSTPGGRWLPGLAGVCIILFAFGSSSTATLQRLGLSVRWLGLFALAGGSMWVALATRRRSTSVVPFLAGAPLVAFALASTLWSESPFLTLARTASFAILLATTAALAWIGAREPAFLQRIVAALAGGVALVAAAGFGLAVISPGEAFMTVGASGWRFRGVGQNPNTVPLLAAVSVPLLLWCVINSRLFRRAWAIAGLVLIVQTVWLSGSRGAILAGCGAVVLQLALMRRPRRWHVRAYTIFAAAVLYGVSSGTLAQAMFHVEVAPPSGGHTIFLSRLVTHDVGAASACSRVSRAAAGSPAPAQTAPTPTSLSVGPPRTDTLLSAVALLVPRPRSLLSGSGRLEAWGQSLGLIGARPLAGHGFGTEATVFGPKACDLPVFKGGRVENSYLGASLELGLVGLALLLGTIATFVRAGRRALRLRVGREHDLVAALIGAVAGGLLIAVVQSYLYSAGNLAALPFWTSCFFLLALAGRAGALTAALDIRGARPLRGDTGRDHNGRAEPLWEEAAEGKAGGAK